MKKRFIEHNGVHPSVYARWKKGSWKPVGQD